MADKFDDFESKLFGWISRHKLGILIIMAPILVWLMLSIAVIGMWGVVGAANVEYQMNQTYHGIPIDTTSMIVTKESYDTMENIILPVTIYMLNTLMILTAVMAIIYSSIIVYLSFRDASRKSKK